MADGAPGNPSLDALLQVEAERLEELNKAFIRYSLAKNSVNQALQATRGRLPGVFTDEWDFNQVAVPLNCPCKRHMSKQAKCTCACIH